jgi:hypothetical protein
MDASVNDLKAERFVNTLRPVVVEPRVRCHLDASVTSRPLLRSRQELRAGALPPVLLGDEPTFNEPDWSFRVAAIGARTLSHLQKAR